MLVARSVVYAAVAYAAVFAVAMLCAAETKAIAQEQDKLQGSEPASGTYPKADAACQALWADHAFDPLRDKIPLGDQKPTLGMLTNPLRITPKDKALADLAIKTLDRCRALYAEANASLPEQTRLRLRGFEREQDALIAQLYTGKITIGAYNVSMNRIAGQLFSTLYGNIQPPSPAGPTQAVTGVPNAKPRPPLPQQSQTSDSALPRQTRLALVIGNSKYADLPKLTNPTNDAHAIVDILRDLGFEVTLTTDASEETTRRAVRKFADQSDQADLALVFYAGHGAQVDGQNYLLPVDMEVPKTESDVELSGLKVDDLVNSIRSPTKIVFLDACRDNPALFKNFVKGRGAGSTGLAPTDASHLARIKPGGGVFIAYATESGSVALEGEGEHSPFTQALLRNLRKPISIDDMFSLVTREVALATKGTQQPYKYASLENIVCLTGSCSPTTAPAPVDDIVHEAQRSESEELQIALQTNNADSLQGFLTKYPESPERPKVLAEIAKMNRSEFREWVLYALGSNRFPQYFQVSSIQHYGDRVSVQTRILADPALPLYGTTKFPEGTYGEQTLVFDCKQSIVGLAATKALSPSGEILGSFKWADPEVLNLSIGVAINSGTVAAFGKRIACDDRLNTPVATRKELEFMNFSDLATTPDGEGEIYYRTIENDQAAPTERDVVVVIKWAKQKRLSDIVLPPGSTLDLGNFRTEVNLERFKCDEERGYFAKIEYYDQDNTLKYLAANSDGVVARNFGEMSPLATLKRILCGTSEGQK